MKKTLLTAAIALSISYTTAAQAADSSSEASVAEDKISLTKTILSETYPETEDLFISAVDESAQMKNLPVEARFGKDKTDAQENIDSLYNEIFEIITDNKIEYYQKQLAKIQDNKTAEQQLLSEMKAQLGLELDKKKFKRLQAGIEKTEKKLTSLELQREEVINSVYQRLTMYGADVSYKQVESLLARVDADDIIAQTTAFPILAEYVKHVNRAAAGATKDLVTSKKYYGLYVAILDVQMYIQNQYLSRIEYQYIPKLTQLRQESKTLVAETKQLMRQSPKSLKAVYQANLDSQRFNLKVIDLYVKILQENARNVRKARDLVKQRHHLGKNTLDTVSIAFNVSSMISANAGLHEAVMSLSMPEMLTFQNSAMQEEFQRLTAQLKQGK